MTKKTKIAIVGCGRIAQVHLEACRRIESIKVTAVADVNEEIARSAAEEFHCQYYLDYKTMLKNATIDAVIICAPPCFHAEIAVCALSLGLHVFCEKPFAIDLKSAQEMIKTAHTQNKLLMMATKFRFTDDVVRAKSMLESRLIGDIILFENIFCSHVNMENRWNSNKRISGGGVLMDNGPHSMDIVRFLLGPIMAIQTQNGKQIQTIDVEDTCRLYFKTSSDVMGTIDLSWSINKNNEYYINIYGTEGSIHIGWTTSHYRRNEQSDWTVFGKGYDKINAFVKQLSHFLNCMYKRENPIITTKDAVESVKVIETAYKSSQIDKWFKIEG